MKNLQDTHVMFEQLKWCSAKIIWNLELYSEEMNHECQVGQCKAPIVLDHLSWPNESERIQLSLLTQSFLSSEYRSLKGITLNVCGKIMRRWAFCESLINEQVLCVDKWRVDTRSSNQHLLSALIVKDDKSTEKKVNWKVCSLFPIESWRIKDIWSI